jgi:UDP-N-acetyl-2-amino-2-deoxyglucuronate dehydrogenase
MADKVGFGLIGCGEIAVATAQEIAKTSNVRIVHTMDVAKELASDLADKYGAPNHTDNVDKLLADPAVEVVVISTPHFLHEPLTVKAVAAGKHVLTEKPIACTLTQADRMIAAADKAGKKLGVLYPVRLNWQWRKVAELVAAGAIGKVIAVKLHTTYNKPEAYWHGGYSGRRKDDWRVSLEKSGGGYLIMNTSHSIDAVVSVLDPKPTRIYAEYGTFATDVEVEDFVSFVMRTEDGALWSADGASAAVGGESHGDRIYGTKGQLAPAWDGVRFFISEPFGDLKVGEWNKISKPADAPDGRRVMVEKFAEAIRTGSEVPVSGREGRRALEIVRGAYLSMKRQKPVTFPVQE